MYSFYFQYYLKDFQTAVSETMEDLLHHVLLSLNNVSMHH